MKKFITLLLIIMCVSTSFVKAQESKINDVTYDRYTFIGDSIAAGHSLEDYTSYGEVGDRHLIKQSYPQLIYDYVSAKEVNCLAIQGFNTSALRYMIDEDYELDELTSLYIGIMTNGKYDSSNFHELSDGFCEGIKNSDLITIHIGSNDYLYSGLNAIFTLSSMYKSLNENKEEGFINSIKGLIEDIRFVINAIEIAKNEINNAEESIKNNWDTIINRVRELNPNAKIVVVGLFNPIKNAVISDSFKLNIGKFVNKTFKRVNNFIINEAKTKDEYSFVDIEDVDVNGYISLVESLAQNDDFFDKLIDCVHPSVQGHQYIAEQISSVLAN